MKTLIKSIVPEALWVRARLFKHRFTKKNFSRKVVEHNYGGHAFKVLIADPLGKGWYDGDWKRLREIEELSKGRLKSGAVVFDCGAHQSVVAMMLAREVGENGKVVALEATRHNYEVGCENLKLNNFKNVLNVHAALGGTSGKAMINESFNASLDIGKGEWGGEEVEVVTLDMMSEKYGRPDVVFIDIEGFEGQALKGGAKLLQSPCDWFVEVHGEEAISKSGSSVKEVLSHFPSERFNLRAGFEGEAFSDFKVGANLDPKYLKRFFLVAIHK